jgi:hypothetical protein
LIFTASSLELALDCLEITYQLLDRGPQTVARGVELGGLERAQGEGVV